MRWIAVATVRDAGALEVTRQALAEADIPVDVMRLGSNPYFPTATASQWEVRVPEDRVDEAEEELTRLEAQAEESVLAEAGVAPEEEDAPEERGHDAAPPDPALRPRKISWAIVISLLVPFPAGCLYARQLPIGYILVGMFIVGWVASFTGMANAVAVVAFARGLDLVLAPYFVVQWNKRLQKEQHGVEP